MLSSTTHPFRPRSLRSSDTLSEEMTSRSADLGDIDSPVVSLRVSVGEEAQEGSEDASRCLPTSEQLKWSPVKSQLTHKTHKPALRKTLFHTEVKSDVRVKNGNLWDTELSLPSFF